MRAACTAVTAIAVWIACGAASAQVFVRFQIDPARSHVAFDTGEVSGRLGLGTFPYASLSAQPGTGPVPLTGHFVAAIAPDLSTPGDVSLVPGTSDVRPLASVLASPGRGAQPGVTDPAVFGLTFDDPFTGVSGELAMRDLVFAIVGNFQVMSNGAGPQGLFGTMPWLQAIGTYDLTTSLGIDESLPLGQVPADPNSFVFSSTSQLTEVSPGVYELNLPFSFGLASFFGPSPVPGPISDVGAYATFTGEIVATTDVPEPGLGLGLGLGAGLLAGFGRIAERRRRARIEASREHRR
jgi:hypothetical protein